MAATDEVTLHTFPNVGEVSPVLILSMSREKVYSCLGIADLNNAHGMVTLINDGAYDLNRQ